MLRMSVCEGEEEIRVHFEGRLAHPNIAEAEGFLTSIFHEHPDSPVCVDLRGVTFIDEKGKDFLKRHATKVNRFLASGCLIRSYVDEIARKDSPDSIRQGNRRS